MSTPLAGRIGELMPEARRLLGEVTAFASVHDASEHAEACRQAAAWTQQAFLDAGIPQVELVPTSDGSLAVLGHRPARDGAPTALLYSHYDVQPAGDPALWSSPAFELTERDGRWYARGAADCKGNLVAHLMALQALGPDSPVGIRVVIEGSEEVGGSGLEDLIAEDPDRIAADVVLIADAGNLATGVPTLVTTLRGVTVVDVTVQTLAGDLHSGLYGGAAPDALAALIQMLSSLRDTDGATTVDGLPEAPAWTGAAYDGEQFRRDTGVLDGVSLIGTGEVADRIWAQPAVTVLAIDAPAVDTSVAAVPARARARVSLRIPPGMDADVAQQTLIAHLRARAPWGARVSFDTHMNGQPFAARTDGPAYAALTAAMETAYGQPVGFAGMGGSIPLCEAIGRALPDAEIALFGVEDPAARIHAPDESVDPTELERIALTEALFLDRLGTRTDA